MTQVIIAARGGAQAKTRCAGLLSAIERDALTALMLEDVLDAVRRTANVLGVWVVTPTPALAVLAGERGAWPIEQEEPASLDAAFRLGIETAADLAPYAATALLMGDLPLLQPNELEAALSLAQTHNLVIAAAADGGTSALVLRAGARFPLAFGPDSFERHQATARRLGFSTAVIEAEGLGRDIDRPEDLFALAAATSDCRAARFLRQRLAGRAPS